MLEIAHPRGREHERQYLYPLVFERWLGLPCRLSAEDRSDVELRMEGRTLVLPEVLFATKDWLGASSLPSDETLYGDDLLGGIFFLITRYEEAIPGALDTHGRFPSSRSITASAAERPLADEYTQLLSRQIEAVWPGSTRFDTRFRVSLSHDVDWPLASSPLPVTLRRAAADALKRRDPDLALRRLRGWALDRAEIDGFDPFDTFDLIMDQSEKADVRSAFYFIADHSHPTLDGTYRIDEPRIRRIIARIAERGHEIGLHGSYESYASADRLRSELDRLRSVAPPREQWGLRQHFLRWQNPSSWRAAAAAGFAYDTTLGFADRAGFRCGTARAYPVFDLIERRQLPLEERPLIVMEAALLRAQEMEARAFIEALRRIKAACRPTGGTLSLLWHNNLLASQKHKTLYREAVEELVS